MVPETNRAKEFQRGTAGVPESAKDGTTGLLEGSDIGLGAGDRAFEPRYSDQKPLGIHDLKGLLLFYIERSWNEIVSVFLLVCYK